MNGPFPIARYLCKHQNEAASRRALWGRRNQLLHLWWERAGLSWLCLVRKDWLYEGWHFRIELTVHKSSLRVQECIGYWNLRVVLDQEVQISLQGLDSKAMSGLTAIFISSLIWHHSAPQSSTDLRRGPSPLYKVIMRSRWAEACKRALQTKKQCLSKCDSGAAAASPVKNVLSSWPGSSVG